MSRVCVIPARGGSQRIPKKNIRPFLGKPIISYSIEVAKASELFDQIVVSTDDPDIRALALLADVTVYRRSPDDGLRGTHEVTAEVLQSLHSEYACCLYPTAPMVDPKDLADALWLLEQDYRKHYCFSVGASPLRDAGQFYWGRAQSFIVGAPLISPLSIMFPVPENRVCDINTESDFLEAERMYAALHRG